MGQSTSVPTQAPPAPAGHPTSGSPPAECPMHASNNVNKYVPTDDQPPTPPTAAPAATTSMSSESNKPAQCPIPHDQRGAGGGSRPNSDVLNPLNQMPDLSHDKAPDQQIDLPTTRTPSSIPRPGSNPTASTPSASLPSNTEAMDPSNPYNTSPNTDDTKVLSLIHI